MFCEGLLEDYSTTHEATQEEEELEVICGVLEDVRVSRAGNDTRAHAHIAR